MTGGISIVGGDEEIAKGDGAGNVELLGNGVCSGSQGLVCLEGRGQVVHPGVATLDGRVVEDVGQEDRVAVDVREEELMMCDEWVCEWEEGTEERRQRGGVSYSLPGWTSHVSTPAQLFRSLS